MDRIPPGKFHHCKVSTYSEQAPAGKRYHTGRLLSRQKKPPGSRENKAPDAVKAQASGILTGRTGAAGKTVAFLENL
jgi:hypothetical protein